MSHHQCNDCGTWLDADDMLYFDDKGYCEECATSIEYQLEQIATQKTLEMEVNYELC
jgi:hypothetical protein